MLKFKYQYWRDPSLWSAIVSCKPSLVLLVDGIYQNAIRSGDCEHDVLVCTRDD